MFRFFVLSLSGKKKDMMQLRTYFSWIFCLILLSIAGNGQAQEAQAILDQAAQAYEQSNGIKANFAIHSVVPQQNISESFEGVINMKGDKFKLETPDMITWYNGETQWSYMKANDEVNVSVPTPEEQQSMNPYTFVNLYKEGYHYQLKETTLRGKSCYEITLTARNKQKSPHTIILDINKDNHSLMCIRMQQRKKGQWTRISIQQLHTGQSFAATDFEFNPKDYPQAEIIDLR